MKYLLILFFCTCLSAKAQTPPNFSFTDIYGKTWNLYDELDSGNVVVLDFFFADCTPCQTFTPMLEQLYQDYGSGTGGVTLLGISDRDNNAKLVQFKSSLNATYPVGGVEGGGDTISDLYANYYPFVGWPTYAVVCSDKSFFWNIYASSGLPEIRDTISHCESINVGIEEQSFKVIELYPIPSNGELNLKLDSKTGSKSQLIISSLDGKTLFQVNLPSGIETYQITLDKLSNGLYIAQLVDNQNKTTKKFIIQK